MSVQVAVRVRPFNQREIDLNSKLVVDMQDGTTTLLCLEDAKKNKDFTFDYSFWSHDCFEINEEGYSIPTDDRYADQQKVYDAVGKQILDNAWQGYHCCLFAYGQTGAGKSYSMVGYKPNVGIVPIACKEIFKRIESNNDPKMEYQVQVSMQEIYNEKIQDLLTPISKRPTAGLKIRENKSLGFYVEGLVKVPVTSYEMVEAKMEEGSKNRTIASTEMNACSSRAHTIITIEFKSIEQQNSKKLEKYSVINLVDLAGSEKVGKTGASGDRLKEAGQINKSLHMLGMVISALADSEMGKKNIKIPYRDSALTKILANALGGNSKTLMICAISPSSDNYAETLSTLRYADQAKKIKCKAIVNESETDKIIRELKEENLNLKIMIENFKKMGIDLTNPSSLNSENLKQLTEMQDQLKSNQMLVADFDKTYEQKVLEAQVEVEEDKIDLSRPHLTNLNEDPLLNGKIQYSLDEEFTYVGRKNGEPAPHIILNGAGIKRNHAIFTNEEGDIYLEPCDQECGEYLYLNGNKLFEKQQIFNHDRLIFGTMTTFLLKIPGGEPREGDPNREIDWEYAQEEMATKADQIKKEEEEKQLKEAEEEKQRQQKILEEKRIKEQKEMELVMQKQQAEYEQKLREFAEKMKEEKDKEKVELEKAEAEREHKENLLKLEADKARKELEREKEKKKIQDLEISKKNKIKEKHFLENKLSKYLPKILEVNLIAKELKRGISMQPKLKYDFKDVNQFSEDRQNKVKINIQVQNREEETVYLWDLGKFSNRYYLIKDLLDKYFENNEIPRLDKDQDPFWDPPEPHLIGISIFKLLSLGYMMDNPVDCQLVGDNGVCGSLKLNIIPTDEEGLRNLAEEMDQDGEIIEDPMELHGKRLDFRIVIESAVLPDNFCRDTFVEYSLLNENAADSSTFKTETKTGKNQKPQYNYSQHHTYSSLSKELITYLQESALCFKVYGLEDIKSNNQQQQQQQQETEKSHVKSQGVKNSAYSNNGTSSNVSRASTATQDHSSTHSTHATDADRQRSQRNNNQDQSNNPQQQTSYHNTNAGNRTNDQQPATKGAATRNPQLVQDDQKKSVSNGNAPTNPRGPINQDQKNANLQRSNTLQNDNNNKNSGSQSSRGANDKDKKKGGCQIF